MLYILPDDIILHIIKIIKNYYSPYLLHIISINHTFKNIVPIIYLKYCKLDYLLNNKSLLKNCCNNNCYLDTYPNNIYDNNINYRRYIHKHQTALNFVLSYNNSKKNTNIFIPYCFECMQIYKPIKLSI